MNNSVNLDIYVSDTEITLINRLSDRSLPRFIHIVNVSTMDGRVIATGITKDTLSIIKREQKVRVEFKDFYALISTVSLSDDSFERFYNDNAREIDEMGIFTDLLFICCYSFLKRFNEDDTAIAELQLSTIISELAMTIPAVSDVDEATLEQPHRIKSYVEALSTKIKEHMFLVERLTTANKTQSKTAGVPTTKFQVEKQRVVNETNITNTSLYDIFNFIELSADAVFASYDKFYKILKTTRVDRNWINTSNEKIIVKVKPLPESDPVDVYFYNENHTLCISYEFENASGSMEKIKKIIPSLTPSIKYETINTRLLDVSGVFYLPNQFMEQYILAHLVLIDPKFSNFFIDESEKATKAKSGMYMYYNYAGEMMSFVVTPKERIKYDTTIKDIPEAVIPIGGKYIRVKITSAKSLDSANALMESFSKVVTLYNNQKVSIEESYTPYVQITTANLTGLQENVKASKTENTLSSKNTTISDIKRLIPTGSDYARRCPFRPLVLNGDEEITSFKEEYTGKPNMIQQYPRDDDPITLSRVTYACHTEQAPYMGLLQLGDHYVPCCYTEPNNKRYNMYYNINQNRKIRQQHIVTTANQLAYNNVGSLEAFPLLENILTMDDITVTRRGIDPGNLSFFQCILDAVGEGYATEASQKGRVEGLKAKLEELFVKGDDLLNVAKQCLYDKSNNDIKKILLSDKFIDPVFFKEMFETAYNCHIVVFNSSGIELCRTAKTTIPKEIDDSLPVVFVLMFKNHCELLCHHKKGKKECEYLFNINEHVCVRYILEMQQRMIRSFIGGTLVEDNLLPHKHIKAQLINSFGKTAAYITTNDYLLYLETPCAPVELPSVTGGNCKTESIDKTIDDISKILKVKTVRQVVVQDEVEILEFTANMTTFFVPVEKSAPVAGIEISQTSFKIPMNSRSMLKKFSQNQKVARYLRAFTCYMFSRYIRENAVAVITEKDINNFVKEKIKIDNSVEYRISKSKLFSDNMNIFIRNEKLVVKSRELLKRLVFCLRVEISQRYQEIIDYHKQISIENFITDVSDFDQHPQQIILEGGESFKQYADELSSVHYVTNSILTDTSKTYFFSNIQVNNGRVYLAKNARSFEEASYYINNFEQYGVVKSGVNNNPLYADIVVYASESDIQHQTDTNKHKLLVYKYENTVFYTVLLYI